MQEVLGEIWKTVTEYIRVNENKTLPGFCFGKGLVKNADRLISDHEKEDGLADSVITIFFSFLSDSSLTGY